MQDEDPIVDATIVGEDTPAPPPSQAAPGVELVAPRAVGSTDLIVAATAREKVEIAAEMATTLDDVIKRQGMRTKVGTSKVVGPDGRESWQDRYHVNVEGWQTLATFLGLAVVPCWSRRVNDPQTGMPERTTYTAKVKRYYPKKDGGGLREETTYDVDGFSWESRVEVFKDGVLIAAGEAMCSRTEHTWHDRDDYALRGMAQTRATSRAIAGAARWIVTLAGYSATPAEEYGAHEAPTGPPAPAGPAYGPDAGDDVVAKLRRAMAWVLGTDPLDPVVADVLGRIEKKAGGYLPWIAYVSIGELLRALKDKAPAARAADDASPRSPTPEPSPGPNEDPAPPPEPEPDTTPPPDEDLDPPGSRWDPGLTDAIKAEKTKTGKLKVLRGAGCVCDDPLKAHPPAADPASSNDACPVHGIPF